MIPFIKIITCCFLLLFQSAIYANNKIYVPFSDINELNLFIDEEEYKDFIRASLFQQPEFNYINSFFQTKTPREIEKFQQN